MTKSGKGLHCRVCRIMSKIILDGENSLRRVGGFGAAGGEDWKAFSTQGRAGAQAPRQGPCLERGARQSREEGAVILGPVGSPGRVASRI